jgi:hypothetical protein
MQRGAQVNACKSQDWCAAKKGVLNEIHQEVLRPAERPTAVVKTLGDSAKDKLAGMVRKELAEILRIIKDGKFW